MTEEEEIAILKDQIEVLTQQIEKMKNCQNCKKYELNKNNKDSILYCCACKLIDSKKEKLIYTKWELAD